MKKVAGSGFSLVLIVVKDENAKYEGTITKGKVINKLIGKIYARRRQRIAINEKISSCDENAKWNDFVSLNTSFTVILSTFFIIFSLYCIKFIHNLFNI